MFLSNALNRFELFTGIGGWPDLPPREPPSEQERIRHLSGLPPVPPSEEILFLGTAMVLSLANLDGRSRVCLSEWQQFQSMMTNPAPEMAFHSASLFLVYNELGSFLSAIRCAQDTLLRLLGATFQVSTPQSMNDLKPTAHKRNRLPKVISERLHRYWKENGKAIRSYRVIDQHYTSLMSRSYIHTAEPQRLVVLLPDDPESRSARSFTFGKRIEASPYFWSELRAFDRLLVDLCVASGGTPRAVQQSFTFRSPVFIARGEERDTVLLVGDAERKIGVLMGHLPDGRIIRRSLPGDKV